jgi:hypothetical protein
MGRYAVIEKGIVTNIIEAEGPDALPGEALLEAHDWTAIGDVLIGGDLPPAPEPDPMEFDPGPDYIKRNDEWWKVRFSKKDFLLLCGIAQVTALNTAISSGNALAKTIHDFLFASEFIDVADPATVQMVQMLASSAAGSVLTNEDAARILQGVKYVQADAE